jgi:hypothetical protein
VIIGYVLTNAICAFVVTSTWHCNHRKSKGLEFWLADFVLAFISMLLIAMRGLIPDFFSMVVANVMVIGGTILLYIGLETYFDCRGPQWQNVILISGFSIVHYYFAFIQPSLMVRNINISVALILLCIQIVWLTVKRVDPATRSAALPVGIVHMLFIAVSVSRIAIDILIPPNDVFFTAGLYSTLMLLGYQMLFILLTFTLFMMVNRRLKIFLEAELNERRTAEIALKEKVSEMERYKTTTVNREIKMMELKDEIAALKQKLAGAGLND